MNNRIINRVNNTKFLGLIVDSELSWKHHINSTTKKLSKAAFIINKAKHVLPPKELNTLYNSIAKPHLDYACEIWGHTNKTFLSPLEIMQKRIIRSIFNLQHRSHTTEYFYKANILKLHDQIFHNTCKYLYKIFHRNVPENIHHLFEINKRKKVNFTVKYSRTQRRAQSIVITGPSIWNRLDINIKSEYSTKRFTSCLKKSLIKKYSVQWTELKQPIIN